MLVSFITLIYQGQTAYYWSYGRLAPLFFYPAVTWSWNPALHFARWRHFTLLPAYPARSSAAIILKFRARWRINQVWLNGNCTVEYVSLYCVKVFFTEIVLFYSCLCLKTNGVSVHDVVCACSDAEGLDAGRRESCQGLSVTLDAWLPSWLNIMPRTCKSSRSVLWDIR